MKFAVKKIAAALALTSAASVATAATQSIIAMTLTDVWDSNTNAPPLTLLGDGTAGPDGLGTDNVSGAFRFIRSIDPDTYAGTTNQGLLRSRFDGNMNGGVINLAGSDPCGIGNPGGAATCFTTGFDYGGSRLAPYINANNGGIVGTVTDGTTLEFSSFAWAALYGFAPVGTQNFENLSPDPGTFVVHNFAPTTTPGEYAYRVAWSHVITTAEDPTGGAYASQPVHWILEGTVAVPEPATYAMMATGLALVGVAARRRRRRAG